MNKREIKFSELSMLDISDIWEYISAYDKEMADMFIENLIERIRGLEDFPFLGATKEIFKENERFLVFKKYNIYYRIEEDIIFIRRILHGKQEISKYL